MADPAVSESAKNREQMSQYMTWYLGQFKQVTNILH